MELETLQKAMIEAMKAKDKERKESISSVIQAVKKVAIDEGHRDDISSELVDKVILKELKSVKEQIDTCPDDRVELKNAYKARYEVISEFAPKLMSAEEVKKIINEKFSELIASGEKSKIMKTVMAEFKGKADGKMINQIISEMLK
ncbi:MAG: GatB/YqeY domain-containing protein [Eubacteriales bacterium]|nr:GatB/YqeY domain-containing protein [Eubacteriales bacterium]